jgi:hypothetical protein
MTLRRDRQEDKASTSPSAYFVGDRNPSVQSSDNMSSQIVSSAAQNRQLHLNATRKILQESKECVKRSIDEVAMEISRYRHVAKMYFKMDYLEQTCQDTKEMVDGYLETLNEIMISFQAALDPYLRTTDDGINYFYRWVAPQWVAQTYGNIMCNMANYMAITSRLANGMIFANANKRG